MKASNAVVSGGGSNKPSGSSSGGSRRGTPDTAFAAVSSLLPPDRFGLADDFGLTDDTVEEKELKELERKLNEEVEEDLFEEPKRFNTLHRVIDVLGLQMIDDATVSKGNTLEKNPAYRNLKVQQKIVEGAIEHMAVIHCADLNGSVIQVGRVARQFSDAVSKVRTLRKQVRDIQDTLGAKDGASASGGAGTHSKGRSQNAAAMSLRELWLKKLECEAVLVLLGRLDVIRAAPSRFDQLVAAPCRIGAAVLTLSRALSTMFSDDVAQVQALHKIMEQLLLRKQKAEEIVWDTMADVIYLRTGNGLLVKPDRKAHAHSVHRDNNTLISGTHSVASESKRSVSNRSAIHPHRSTAPSSGSVMSGSMSLSGIINPFMGQFQHHAPSVDDHDDDDTSVDSNNSGASLFSLEDPENDGSVEKSMVSDTSSFVQQKRMMIPIPVLEAELDLEADERRCLEEIALSGMAVTGRQQRPLPRYADPVLALRILVECLAQLGRLDDVERVISEGLNLEIRQIVQHEQARMFQRLQRKRAAVTIRSSARSDSFKDFRRHLTGLLSSFGCVMVRLSHLAEVLRIRISSDRELLQKVESPSSLMRTVITAASEIMQREIKEFLKACLHESEVSAKDMIEQPGVGEGAKVYENGLFSLGIADTGPRQQVVATATRSNVMEMSTTKFVVTVLFPKTKAKPQVRHALSFRRSVARWTSEVDALKKELSTLTGEDTSAPSYTSREQSAIGFLDDVIQKSLLPVLQEEAVNGTVKGLERKEAFDAVLSRGMYATANASEPQDVAMCVACQAMFQSTGPLFLALHRLPRGGEMYMPLVAVLEHVMLTFISRVKQQVAKCCEKKTADKLVLLEGQGSPLASIMERRRPFSLLTLAYSDGDFLESGDHAGRQRTGMVALAPPETDTSSRLMDRTTSLKEDPAFEDVGDGLEGEENLMTMELKYLLPYLDFDSTGLATKVVKCSDDELKSAVGLAHSLLKLAGLLESRIRIRGNAGFNRALTSTRTLREAIKTIKANGIKMAKFCRLDMIMQVTSRMSNVMHSSTLASRDAVRIPSSVNELGEYLTGVTDNLRESAGNAVTAYVFSSLEQYIPFCLIQSVRVVAAGKGVVATSTLTMNGVESLDRSGSVLYRDLKGCTSFDNSFWDVELAAVHFERSASFLSMMELEMEELVAYYSANRDEFSEEDFALMFAMTGPRRRGDVGRYHLTRKNLDS